MHGACFFFILYFPTGEGLPSDSVCVYRYLFLSSYRFRVEAVEAALPNTSLVINKYYFEAALPKEIVKQNTTLAIETYLNSDHTSFLPDH